MRASLSTEPPYKPKLSYFYARARARARKYLLRDWEDGDWSPEGFKGAYTLEYDGEQVGAAEGSINRIYGIKTRPPQSGHCQKFIVLIMKQAMLESHTCMIFESVIGDTSENKEIMEHILDKLGFTEIEEDTWCKKL